jgi:LPXTG-motif cell wall-anchored protein
VAAADGGLDPDTLMTLGGIGIILAAVVALIAIRRRRNNRDMANAFNDTQVGT